MDVSRVRNTGAGADLVSDPARDGSGRHEAGSSTNRRATTLASGANTDWLDVAAVLLVIQAGIGLIAALGTIVFGASVHDLAGMAGVVLIALAVPAAMIWLAGGLRATRRWARIGALILELIVLAGAIGRLLIGRELAFGLLPVLTSVLLPLAVIVSIFRGRERES